MKIVANYEICKNTDMVGQILYYWINIQANENMLWSTIDRLIIGWVEGKHDLIYDTKDIIR